MKTRNRAPSHPGEILQFEFLEMLDMNQHTLAERIGCEPKVIDRLIEGSASITVDMANRLAAEFGTTAQLWLNLQWC
jgi:addiction module HigA family antidote